MGPLVIVCAAIAQDRLSILKELGVKDSKLLTEKQREEIFKNIEHQLKYELTIIQPKDIDEAVNAKSYNLNWLEADKAADLLNKIDTKLDNDVSEVIVDCPSNNTNAYKNYLKQKVDNEEMKLTVEHKADLNHLIVGAASIIAKVTREKEIEKIKKKIKIDFGSGYPSDPKTKEFLKKYYSQYPLIFRKSWEPYKSIVSSKSQTKLFS
ncbi:TPA: ribonuclease HII [Candidatus Woesearchaeota archaeon]|nr:ribonuclease HII [Candidatus Woesearchaeota archaeon]HIH31761.1 ribonuclease HII [Candidatus Woesearchaeota archaeon]HIH54678.1 ribonuclease HII [Candidatus Woesearchaeota archaeon]HIJ01565.1 ribonuclease HII [Candidatus Woesearchaeota archaeon]HIJ13968.1 ribonuclease HII [Candidatus Woesearchaeota archaeon]